MSKYTKAKRKWVDKNIYSFSIDNGRDYDSIFHEELIFSKEWTKSNYSGSLSSDFLQIKEKFDTGWFSRNFWIAREFCRKNGYKFGFVNRII